VCCIALHAQYARPCPQAEQGLLRACLLFPAAVPSNLAQKGLSSELNTLSARLQWCCLIVTELLLAEAGLFYQPHHVSTVQCTGQAVAQARARRGLNMSSSCQLSGLTVAGHAVSNWL
jgi:hypothetical protein